MLTTTANGLPTNGITVYATLYSLINGAWIPNAYTYTAYGVATAPGAFLTTPNPGRLLTGSTVTFELDFGFRGYGLLAGFWQRGLVATNTNNPETYGQM